MSNYALYRPLKNVVTSDDFDKGLCGWSPLTPNFRPDRFDYFDSQKRYAQWGGPSLSNATFSFLGTHGSMSGTYSMKLTTRPTAAPPEQQPAPGSIAHAIKRLTLPMTGFIRVEMWFTFKAEQDRPSLGENDIRAFGFFCDTQDQEHRYFWGARYVNAAAGSPVRKWQIIKAHDGTDEEWGDMGESAVGEINDDRKTYLVRGIDPQWLGRRDAFGNADGFTDVPGGEQSLCFNETADKINWHYFSMTFDLSRRQYVAMQSLDRRYDLSGIQPTLTDPYPRVWQLLNPVVWIEADTDRRVMFFVDSIVISTSESLEGDTK